MKNNLFFTCGFQGEQDWVILSNRQLVTSQDEEKLLCMLSNIGHSVGGARLEIIPEPDVGVSELSVQYDGKNYLFDLLEYREDGSISVRTQANFHGEPGLTYFSGELFPSSQVIADFEFIKTVFVEFLKTGNVSYDLMKE